MKILTYNIHKGFSRYNRVFVLHQIKEQIRKIDVDVVLLQEIHGRHDRHQSRVDGWPAESQFEFLADDIWSHHAYAKNAVYEQGHHGNAILSRFPISEWQNYNLSRFKMASRSFLHGIIQVPDCQQPLHLVCVHLGLSGFERKRQLRELKHYIETTVLADDPLIIAGDFNDWNGQIGKQLEAQLKMHEVIRHRQGSYAKTFPSNWPILRMDRIYFRNLDLIDSSCLSRYEWGNLSDHLPLFAQLDLNPGKQGTG